MRARIPTKGQLVLPKEICTIPAGLGPGSEVEIEEVPAGILLGMIRATKRVEIDTVTSTVFALSMAVALCACHTESRAPVRPTVAVTADVPSPAPVDAAVRPVAPPPRMLVNCSGTRQQTMGAECWFPGQSCEGRGGDPVPPFALRGTFVEGGSVHGGCNFTTFALVYEPRTSPLRVRVCAILSAPMDCPAMADDHARWDIAPLLAENGATRAVIVRGARPRR